MNAQRLSLILYLQWVTPAHTGPHDANKYATNFANKSVQQLCHRCHLNVLKQQENCCEPHREKQKRWHDNFRNASFSHSIRICAIFHFHRSNRSDLWMLSLDTKYRYDFESHVCIPVMTPRCQFDWIRFIWLLFVCFLFGFIPPSSLSQHFSFQIVVLNVCSFIHAFFFNRFCMIYSHSLFPVRSSASTSIHCRFSGFSSHGAILPVSVRIVCIFELVIHVVLLRLFLLMRRKCVRFHLLPVTHNPSVEKTVRVPTISS